MKKRKTVAERLLERLRRHPELAAQIGSKAEIIRTYVGKHQRADGAWSWMVYPSGDIGSPDNMTDCLKCDRLKCYESTVGALEISAEYDKNP